jgi:hypothetical protein
MLARVNRIALAFIFAAFVPTSARRLLRRPSHSRRTPRKDILGVSLVTSAIPCYNSEDDCGFSYPYFATGVTEKS